MKKEFKNINKNDNEITERTSLRQKFESIDDVLPFVGNFGNYQKYLLIALFPYCIIYSNLYFSTFFLTLVPQEHWCYVDELQNINLTAEQRIEAAIPASTEYPYYDKCRQKNINFSQLLSLSGKKAVDDDNFKKIVKEWQTNETIDCNKWEYNMSAVPYLSIGSELGWVCNQEYLMSTAQAIFFCGSILGGFLFGWIADHNGRIPALVGCNLIALFGTIATGFASTFYEFAFCRFITGFAFDNCINIPLILVVEYMSVKRRTLVFNIAFGVHFAIGSTLLPWIAYYVANWRHLAYIVAIPMVFGLFTPWILPESARWYATKGKWDKVVMNLKKISKINGMNPDPMIYDNFVRNASSTHKRNESSATLLDLFKTPRLARTTILIISFWTMTIICFDGHVYSLKLLQSSVFVSFSLASATELPAGLLVTLILDRWGRRFCGFITITGIGICSFSELYLPSPEAKLASSVFARFCGNMAANIGLQYAAEVLPTPVRGQGVALVHIFGILAHAVSPYITDLVFIWTGLPMMFIGITALLTGLLVLFLPETLGRDLPQTLQEGEDFSKGQKFWSFPFFNRSDDGDL